MFNLTKKQEEFLFYEDKRLNFLDGSVRSGKTYVSLLKWGIWISQQPIEYAYIMVGKTITSLKRNCFNYLEQFFGTSNFVYSTTNKTAHLFGRLIYLEGANDERSENKIRGMTLAGAYCDEVTLYPESFFTMLLSRLSVVGAKMWATCNPDSPNHYIKKNYIDREEELNCKVWHFILIENEFLPKEYIDSLSTEYQGIFYNRFVLGQWVRAEGIIYRKFADDTQNFILPENFNMRNIVAINIGVDFGGNRSATTFVCTGFTRYYKDVVVLEAERHEEELSPEQLDKAYCDFVKSCYKRYGKFAYTYVDSAEQILIRGLINSALRNGVQTNVMNAKKMPILDRIQLVQKLQGQGRFWVAKHCTTVIRALQDAVWDSKKENERLDDGSTDIDTMDALEYSLEPAYRELMDYIEIGKEK